MAGPGRVATPSEFGYPPAQVIAMPQFYLLWVQLFVNVLRAR